jgi:hypothetical protein
LITCFYFIIIVRTHSNKQSPHSNEQSPHSFISTTIVYSQCNFIPSTDEFIRTYIPYNRLGTIRDATRVEPSMERIRSLLEKVRSKEDSYQSLLDTFDVFNMIDPEGSFKPYVYGSDIDEIKMLYNRYITLMGDHKTIQLGETFINYLRKISSYLSDGLTNERTKIVSWKGLDFIHYHFFSSIEISFQLNVFVNQFLLRLVMGLFLMDFKVLFVHLILIGLIMKLLFTIWVIQMNNKN